MGHYFSEQFTNAEMVGGFVFLLGVALFTIYVLKTGRIPILSGLRRKHSKVAEKADLPPVEEVAVAEIAAHVAPEEKPEDVKIELPLAEKVSSKPMEKAEELKHEKESSIFRRRGSDKKKWEEEVIAYLGIYDHTGHVPAMVPLMRKQVTSEKILFEWEDGSKDEFTHGNPFTILGKNVREVVYLCPEYSTTCVNPEDWFKRYHIEGFLTGHTLEYVQRLSEVRKGSQPQFSSMKNLGLLLVVGLAFVGVGILLNMFILHGGYTHVVVANATVAGA